MKNTILVTGGAGFIGGNFVLHWIGQSQGAIVNLDKLTYAGHAKTLETLAGNPDYQFVHGDICDAVVVRQLLEANRPWAIVHFAAESHVDRSIHDPDAFVRTNIVGTYTLLQAARDYFETLIGEERAQFRFLHISTDEVYGSLAPEDAAFTESTPYAPNSPYAASKAASDLLARAWSHTYKLPVVVMNCSNNFGPYQSPEKLIPLMIVNALEGRPLPIYGDGLQVRDWLFVEDNCRAIAAVLRKGRIGETYNVGGSNQRSNQEVVRTVCSLLDELVPDSPYRPHAQLIAQVTDRAGHDRRYAMNATKLEQETGWTPEESFESGLRKTVEWYLANEEWVAQAASDEHRRWLSMHYGSGALLKGTR